MARPDSKPRVEYKVWIEIEEVHYDLDGIDREYVADLCPVLAAEPNTREEAEEYRQGLIEDAPEALDRALWEYLTGQ